MPKKIRRKRLDNPVNTQVVKTLSQIQGVADILKGGVGDIQDVMAELQHDLYVVQEALEMNFWVHLKMQMDGHFDPTSKARKDPEVMMSVAQEYQQEYLTTLAVVAFVCTLATKGVPNPA